MVILPLALVLAAPAGEFLGSAASPALLVRGPERFEPVPTNGAGTPILLPLLSRSEVVLRAAPTSRGIGLRTRAGIEVGVSTVEHADDERIAVDASGRLVRLSGLHAPYSVRTAPEGPELGPWTVRLDRNVLSHTVSSAAIDVRNAREGERVVVFPGMPDPSVCRVLPEGETRLTIDPGTTVDLIVLARITPIEAERSVQAASEARGEDELVERWYELPVQTEPGRTLTFVVRGDFPAWSASPAASSVERALFRDVSRESGIDMIHMEGPDLQLDIRPTMGPGAALGDVDGDGWVDLFLPQGGGRAGSAVAKSKLYRNRGDGTFEDVSVASGLALEGAGMGALFLDADGDGDLDLFVANYGRNRFLLNDGAGKFTDVSQAVGLATDRWHAAVSAADQDGDGDLDLYVSSYLVYDESQMPPLQELGRYQREDPVAMLPYAFPGEKKLMLRNDARPVREASTGDAPSFHFVDVAQEAGLVDEPGRGMQALFFDFDRDGDQDLYLANDVSPNRFWRNEGRGKWKDIGFSTGVDDPRGSMGLAVGDVDGDGDEDLFVTNWQLEANALYLNNLVNRTSARSRKATFRDVAVQAGLAQMSVGVTKWGCELVDFDLDGDLDLAYANGYTSPDYEGTGICVAQPNHYFENDGEGHFTAAFERAGLEFMAPLSSRCLLACDYDQDGDLDLVVTANNGRARLFRNDLQRGSRHWLGVRLVGRGSNTHAIGAEVELVVDGRTLRRSQRAGTSYLGGNAPELHFGLGTSARITSCRVRWPDGRESTHDVPESDRFVTLREP